MADIFISYARADRTRVQLLADALAAHGWSVWWDRQIQAGKTFDQVIAQALSSARCVLVVWSPQSIASEWVREEADEGRRRRILIPVLIDGARPPLGFGRIQAVDLGHWTGDLSSDALKQLIGDVAALIGPPHSQIQGSAASQSVEDPSGARTSDSRSATALPGRTRQAALALRKFGALNRRATRTYAAACVLAVALGVYWLRSGDDTVSQPRPVTAPSNESVLRLNAVLIDGGKPLPRGVRYDVYEAAQDAEGNRKRVTSSDWHQDPPRFPLPAGHYYVTATYGSASAGTAVEVFDRTTTLQALNLRAGILSLSTVLATGGKPLMRGVRYDVSEAAQDAEGNRKQVTSSDWYQDPPRFPLPAGRYYVAASSDVGKDGSDVSISPGEVRPLRLRLSRQNDRK